MWSRMWLKLFVFEPFRARLLSVRSFESFALLCDFLRPSSSLTASHSLNFLFIYFTAHKRTMVIFTRKLCKKNFHAHHRGSWMATAATWQLPSSHIALPPRALCLASVYIWFSSDKIVCFVSPPFHEVTTSPCGKWRRKQIVVFSAYF